LALFTFCFFFYFFIHPSNVITFTTLKKIGSTVCVWGENCTLPCTFSFGNDILIHWYYETTRNVHSYYDNRDHLGQQISQFQKRTSLFHEEIPKGNASLLLMRVQVADEGPYLCYTSTISDSSRKNIDLQVEALVREVNVVRVNDSITCSSERIYPEPTLSWSIDPQQAHKPEVQVTEDQLYSISSTIVVNGSSNQN
uniref:Ig-like domain-containing protein n=1 Tax=Tetraodon nigroviridis TaxID=99883 RepID=H3C2K6_TETNG